MNIEGQQFSSRGRMIRQPEQKNQIAADALASMASVRAARKNAMRQQLQAYPQLTQQLQSLLQTQDDLDILNELFSEMTTGRGGKRSKKRMTKRRRTLKKRTLKKIRRY